MKVDKQNFLTTSKPQKKKEEEEEEEEEEKKKMEIQIFFSQCLSIWLMLKFQIFRLL